MVVSVEAQTRTNEAEIAVPQPTFFNDFFKNNRKIKKH